MPPDSDDMSDQNTLRQSSKVFIGGLSWETTGEKLRSYFENYGVVREAFVSYNRNNGRPRGFGFVVFESSEVADKVVACKHTIDRREVEAKKAVPKDEQLLQGGDGGHPFAQQGHGGSNGIGGGASSSDGSAKSRKIFVGGLAPSVDDAALRQYFETFGVVEDAVVMYDHENRRPRGFGFVTFATEESVEMVFAKGSLQCIADKQIEIKSAVPRDQMPPSARPMQNNNYYDPRFGPTPGPRNGNPYPYGPSSYGPPMGMPSQFNGLPPRGGYGGPRNYAPSIQPQAQGRGQRYSDGAYGTGVPTGFQPSVSSRPVGGGGMSGKVSGIPPGYDLYAGGAAASGMFGGPNSQAALAYNLATLQQQAQAHLNGMQATVGSVSGGSKPNSYSQQANAAAALNLKALSALAAGGTFGFPGGGSDGYGGVGDDGAEVDYVEAAAAAAAAAGLAAAAEYTSFRHDVGQFATPSTGWTN